MKNEYTADFERFWQLYPNKSGKFPALKAWNKIKPSETQIMFICNCVRKQVKSGQLHKNKIKKGDPWKPSTPHASTWLNNRRWEDEIVQQKKTPEQREAKCRAARDRQAAIQAKRRAAENKGADEREQKRRELQRQHFGKTARTNLRKGVANG